MEGMLMAGMYGYSDEDWEYIWKNADFWEVFIPSANGAKNIQSFFHELFGYVGYYLKGNI